MELDDLKYQLKHKLSADHANRSSEDISELLKRKTTSIISKLKRSLWIEIVSCLVIILVFSYIGIAGNNAALQIYFSVFALFSVAFLALLIYLLQHTSRLCATSLPVKGNLQMIVTNIEAFVKRYFQFTMALIPVCFIFAFFLGYYDPHPFPVVTGFVKVLLPMSWMKYTIIGIYLLILPVGIYYFTKWYLNKLYGNYLLQLKSCISELSEDE